MHPTFETLCNVLDKHSEKIIASWAEKLTLQEVYGWHHPPLTKYDLAFIPKNLSNKIRNTDPIDIDDKLNTILEEIPRRLELLEASTIPYIFNGNGQHAIPAFMSTMEWIESLLEPVLSWQVINDPKAMPANLAKKIRRLNAELSEIMPEKESLQDQIKLIQDATSAAESLPTDMAGLRDARKKVDAWAIQSAELFGQIDLHSKNSHSTFEKINDKKLEADKLVSQCEEAYRITTTKGLAAAFDQRANQLANSMWVWVIGLLLALVIGSILGYLRIGLLSSELKATNPQWGIIWIHIILSVLSIGAPLWFAWISTKQIGQRFRLSEDYAFKASVAKAYEGYRKEAARIDSAFEARLFSSALSRLEEAPLRLVEEDTHGSPWHEFFSSKYFQNALKSIPGLKDKYIATMKNSEEKISEE